MGGNTSTIYADIFISYKLSLIRGKLEKLGVRLIKKYVDDFIMYMPRKNVSKVLGLLRSITGLQFTVEYPNCKGELPYLDLMVVNNSGQLITRWYRKEITSERSVNYFSNVPRYEFVNTFMMRFVVASLYDSGGGFLRSYWVLLRESWYNSIPKRFIQLILHKASNYYLGRCEGHKRALLKLLASEIYNLDLSMVLYESFLDALADVARLRGLSSGLFCFKDDMRAVCNPVKVKRNFWTPGDPIHVFTYRGQQSMELYDTVRQCYPGFPVAIRHNTSFNGKSLACGNGLKRKLNYID